MHLQGELMDTKNEPKKADPQEQSTLSNAQIAKMMSDAVAEALKHAIPAAAVGINAANLQAQQNDNAKRAEAIRKRLQRCAVCLLPETACGGPWEKNADGSDKKENNTDGSPKYCPSANHLKVYVGPKDDNLRRHFDAVWVNGVPFKSFRPGELVWIPKKSDILTTISNWEKNERELSQRRVAEGSGAGSVGPGGVQHKGNPAAIGWR
jgi:hypothetical protein